MSVSPYAVTVVEPLTITDSILVSSNVAENDYAVWAIGTTYADGDRVIMTSTHKIYESLQNANVGNNPTTSVGYWVEVGPTNRWRVFDTSNSSQTVTDGSPNTISYTLEAGVAITAVGILNITDGREVQITVTDPVAGVVYDVDEIIGTFPQYPEWWSFFFGTRFANTQFIRADLPSYPNAEITITITGTSTLAVGVILIGQQTSFSLGMQYGARVGIQDYSRKETNTFGETVLIQRAYAKRANFDLFLEKYEVDLLQNFLSKIRAVPVLWVGSSDFEATVIFGFYKNFDILLSYPEHAECSLEIEGLT